MSDNLALWHQVEKTPPNQTKPITGKPYKGNSPKPYWLVHRATETFGPCGIGWGFEILNERVEEGSAGDRVHIAHIRVWYKWNGERGQVEHIGQTMLAGKNKNGPYTDEDAPKKSVTDGLTKALSMIGFAGDIFMGRYDDSKYVADLNEEVAEGAKRISVAKLKEAEWPKFKPLIDAAPDGPALVKAYGPWFERALNENWARGFVDEMAKAVIDRAFELAKAEADECEDVDALRSCTAWWLNEAKAFEWEAVDFNALKAEFVKAAATLKARQEGADPDTGEMPPMPGLGLPGTHGNYRQASEGR